MKQIVGIAKVEVLDGDADTGVLKPERELGSTQYFLLYAASPRKPWTALSQHLLQ